VNSPIANKAETAEVLPAKTKEAEAQASKTKDSEAGGSLRSNTRGVIIDQSTTDDDDGDGDDDEARITKTKEAKTRASKTKEPEPRTALRSNTRGIINVQSTTDDYDDDDEGAATVTMAKTAKALAARIKMPEEHAVKTKEPGTQAAKTKDPDTQAAKTKESDAQEASKGQLAKTSTRLQTMAQDAALRAIKTHRNGVDSNLCVTTLDVNELSVDERKFLLFSAPPPLEEMPNSMLSWHKALQGRGDDRPLGTFVVIANDLKTRQLCNEHGIPTMCTEHSEEGLPILDRMLLRMHESLPDTAGIVGYVNSDITARNLKGLDQLFEKLQDTALEVQQTPEQIYLPFNATGKKSDNWFAVATRTNINEKGEEYTHSFGGFDFWAWNTKPKGGVPLLPFSMPHFRFPFACYDNWLLDMVVQSGQRNAIDASAVIDMVHYDHVKVGGNKDWYHALVSGVTGVFMNRHLSFNEPRKSLEDLPPSPYTDLHHINQFGTPLDTPYKIEIKDLGTPDEELSVAKRKYWSNLNEEDLAKSGCAGNPELCEPREKLMRKTAADERMVQIIPGVHDWEDPSNRKGRNAKMEQAVIDNWRYTLKQQVKKRATDSGFVLLVAVNYGYREMLMNFLCNLERVGGRDHVVVAALDQMMYEWGLREGLPVFLAGTAQTESSSPASDTSEAGVYGGNVFKSVTKSKSRVVLEVLKAGYSVVWTDVDITWFVNPLDALEGFMKNHSGIAIQTNAPYLHNPSKPTKPHESVGVIGKTDDPAGFRRLNSGLYVAPNNPLVISAFEEIVAHAAQSKLSEQPSFDHILCAQETSERGYNSCFYRPSSSNTTTAGNGFHVEMLDRFRFPNGAVMVGEENDNIYEIGREQYNKLAGKEVYAAHNNWIKEETSKKKRQETRGWWL